VSAKAARGSLALVGGGEWGEGSRDLDRELLEASGASEVLILPTAAAFEHPDRAVERATAHFEGLGATARGLAVIHRAEAEDVDLAEQVEAARFVYLSDGSPLHLRSVLKDSVLFEAVRTAFRRGAVLAASGAGATVICDPMIDPRGGAYTVGLGVVSGLAVFPYHGSAAEHLRERSIDLLPERAVLAGVDEATALVHGADGGWHVAGAGTVAVYRGREPVRYETGAIVEGLPEPSE
jgi:cyanophycinase